MKPSSDHGKFDFHKVADSQFIDNGIIAVEKALGVTLTEGQVRDARYNFFDYIANARAGSPSLKESRQELEEISELADRLLRRLKNIGGPADHALDESRRRYSMSKCKPISESKAPEIQDDLRALRLYAQDALEHAPKTGKGKGWQKELVPEKELIRDMARLYEWVRGEKAQDNISRTTKDPVEVDGGGVAFKERYKGEFFGFIEQIFDALEIPAGDKNKKNAHQNLGRLIERSINK